MRCSIGGGASANWPPCVRLTKRDDGCFVNLSVPSPALDGRVGMHAWHRPVIRLSWSACSRAGAPDRFATAPRAWRFSQSGPERGSERLYPPRFGSIAPTRRTSTKTEEGLVRHKSSSFGPPLTPCRGPDNRRQRQQMTAYTSSRTGRPVKTTLLLPTRATRVGDRSAGTSPVRRAATTRPAV